MQGWWVDTNFPLSSSRPLAPPRVLSNALYLQLDHHPLLPGRDAVRPQRAVVVELRALQEGHDVAGVDAEVGSHGGLHVLHGGIDGYRHGVAEPVRLDDEIDRRGGCYSVHSVHSVHGNTI